MLLPRALALAGILCVGALSADVAVPPLQARVTDLTGTLSAAESSALETKLAAFEADKGSQLAVLIVPSTQPETIEQYGIRVGEQWKLGRKGVDDGAILIVAKDDRRLRIEVGYGLEGALNDATTKRIISETITPHFKQGRFYEGIDAGVDQILKVVRGEPLPEPEKRAVAQQDLGGMLGWLFIALFVVAPILRTMFGRLLGAGFTGGLTAFVVYMVTGLLVAAILAALFGLVAGLLFGGGGRRRWSSGRRGWSGFGGGGFGGGGFGGGGGGGFSGGGGSFGGGGSSGSW